MVSSANFPQASNHVKHYSCNSPFKPLQGGSSSGNVVVMGDSSPTKRAYKTLTASLVPSSSLKNATPCQSSSSNPKDAGPNIKLTSQSLIDLLGTRYAKSGSSSYETPNNISHQMDLSDLIMSKGLGVVINNGATNSNVLPVAEIDAHYLNQYSGLPDPTPNSQAINNEKTVLYRLLHEKKESEN